MTGFAVCPAVLIAGMLTGPAFAGQAPNENSLLFRVLLDGRPIGEHRFEVRSENDIREVTSEAEFRVRILFIDAYRYRHTATELWHGDCLVSLDARTNDNGEIMTVDASRSGDGLAVNATGNESWHAGCVRSFAYWNAGILEATRLLNTQTGQYQPVRVELLGEDRIAVNGSIEAALRYRLTGEDINIDLWYTRENEWVALESEVEDGRLLRYQRI